MERIGLSDKTKDELIDIILCKNYAEKSMSEELTATALKLKEVKSERDKLVKVCCQQTIMLMVFLIFSFWIVIYR